MFMLNLASHTKHEKATELQLERVYYAHFATAEAHTGHRVISQGEERASMHEIYWNIKFNHGMESINNNFRMKPENDWMDGKTT